MKAKHIFLGLVVLTVIAFTYFYINGKFSTGSQTVDEPKSAIPSVQELIAKGYSKDEATQIITALEAGKDINY